MKVAGPPTTRCGSLCCDTISPPEPSRRNMRCKELSSMKIKEPRGVSISAPLEAAAGKAACQSSRPVAPSNFITVTPDITMTLSRPDRARTISGGIGTPLPLIEVHFDYSRRRKITQRFCQRRDAPEIFARWQFGNLTFIPVNHSIKNDVCESEVKSELQAIT